MAEEKGLYFKIIRHDNLPDTIVSDRFRLQQILNNFLSNALKFTEDGGVTIYVHQPTQINNPLLHNKNLDTAHALAISISDTGKGIAPDKQRLIFEAFQQEDGTTSRKYGGTGLGLSISKELTKLLDGELTVESDPGKGSTFTIFLPVHGPGIIRRGGAQLSATDKKSGESSIEKDEDFPNPVEKSSHHVKPNIKDDRDSLQPHDKSVLIVDDDIAFVRILVDVAHKKNFKCLVTADGQEALTFARRYKPSAIILDIGLPGSNGLTIMAELKSDPDTRHIPVHFISASDDVAETRRLGAVGYLQKPTSIEDLQHAFNRVEKVIQSKIKKLLIVEDDPVEQKSIISMLQGDDIEIVAVTKGADALKALQDGWFDCVILDLGLSDISGFEIIEHIRNHEKQKDVAIIVNTGSELSDNERKRLEKYTESVIIKNEHSLQQLLDESTLFLHRVETQLPPEKQQIIRMLHNKDRIFHDKKILVVDDDMRNVFALTHILEDRGVHVIAARNGKDGLDKLRENPDVDLILMDIMMPEMDGYETIQRIRAQDKFKMVPIIALTAKVMPEDRAKCIEAGANDYMAKPIQEKKFISLLRVWLYQKRAV